MLEQIALFADLPRAQLDALESRGVVRRFPKGAIVMLEGDASSQLFVIKTGKVRVYSDGADGRHVILNYLGPGDYFGELSLIDDHPRSASVTTITACELLIIPGELFRKLMCDHPSLREQLMRQMAMTIRTLTSTVKDLALLDVYRRVVRVLERLSAAAYHAGEPRLTHQDIASMTGASREMVGKIMKDLTRGEYIDQSGGRIQIKRPMPSRW